MSHLILVSTFFFFHSFYTVVHTQGHLRVMRYTACH
jgi:hypothetical protein